MLRRLFTFIVLTSLVFGQWSYNWTTSPMTATILGDISSQDVSAVQITASDTVFLTKGSQNYIFTDRSAFLALQGQTAGTNAGVDFFSADGDSSDDVAVNLFGFGTPSSVNPSEFLSVKWDASEAEYSMSSNIAGAGTLYPLVLYTEGNTDQLHLDTGGLVGVNTDPTELFHVDQDADDVGALFSKTHAGTSHPTVKIQTLQTTNEQISLGLYKNALGTSHFYRNLASTSTAGDVVFIEQDHASDDQDALAIQQDGTGYAVNVTAGNVKFDGRFEAGGGSSATTNAPILFDPTTTTDASNGAVFKIEGSITGGDGLNVWNSRLVPTGTTVTTTSGAVGYAGTLALFEPVITKVGANAITNSATLYIGSAADEATNNYGVWVDAGDSRFDGNVIIGGTTANADLEIKTAVAASIQEGLRFWNSHGSAGAGASINFGAGSSYSLKGKIAMEMQSGGQGELVFYTSAGATEALRLHDDETAEFDESVFINDNANAGMTQGVTINQGANDDEILAFKSSDVTHAMTELGEADTYGLVRKISAANGGVLLRGMSGASNTADGVLLQGNLGHATPTTGAAVRLQGRITDGATGVVAMGADDYVVQVENHTTELLNIYGDGDVDINGTTINFGGSANADLKLDFVATASDAEMLFREDEDEILFQQASGGVRFASDSPVDVDSDLTVDGSILGIGGTGEDIASFRDDVAASGNGNYTIPTGCSGLMIFNENVAGHYGLVLFNNISGTLTITELNDSGTHISTSGTDIVINNNHGGAAFQNVTFIGRDVDDITYAES